jgi:hypothetical protein
MSYPINPEQRLIMLYGYTPEQLNKIFVDCKRDKAKYMETLNNLDKKIAANVMAQVLDENTFLH